MKLVATEPSRVAVVMAATAALVLPFAAQVARADEAPIIMATLASTAVTAPASTDVRQKVVPYGDLNLASAKGRAALQKRLVVAVDDVCVGRESRDLASQKAARDCRDKAMVNAQRQADAIVATAVANR